jgi:polyphosphate kinase
MAKKEVHKILNRDISWLSFNERVLQEATDPKVPLIERIRFMGIFSRNRDEFFRVRVATLQRMLKAGGKSVELIGEKPAQLVKDIQEIVTLQQHMLEDIFQAKLAELEKENIFMLNETQLDPDQGVFVRNHFLERVLPYLVPLMIDEESGFPYLRDKSSFLFLRISKKGKDKKTTYSIIELPTHVMSRFVVLPRKGDKHFIMMLDDVIRFGLDEIFYIFDYDRIDSHMIKITRDAEMDIEYDYSQHIVEKITKGLKGRKVGHIVRFTYDGDMPIEMLRFISKKMKLGRDNNMVTGGRYHNFKDLFDFPTLGKESLTYPPIVPLRHPAFDHERSLFKILKERDLLLYFPYQSYGHILDVLREASIDPQVQSIKLTLYRAASNSNVLNALVNAVRNGKQVTVVVEVQARFDEEANIQWSQKLQEVGARVIFGVQGLKVHSKLFLITRKEENKLVRYAHIGTGNFNEQTARVYGDISLLTGDLRITSEVSALFDFYNDNLKIHRFRHLLVAPFGMRRKLLDLIQKEIDSARQGRAAFIDAKMNSLVDQEIIQKLYEASNAGVRIRLVVRGICSLIPGRKGSSQNISVVSIIDRYLEHARVFVFGNQGDPKVFLSSADWMIRNFDHRSEVAVPIFNSDLKGQLREFLELQFRDNTKARLIDRDQTNPYRRVPGKSYRAQADAYVFLANVHKKKM